MSMFDQLKGLADGKHPIQLAAAGVDALGRIATALETVVAAMPDPSCAECDVAGSLYCSQHGSPAFRGKGV